MGSHPSPSRGARALSARRAPRSARRAASRHPRRIDGGRRRLRAARLSRVESSGTRRTARRFAVTRRANGLVRERDGARHGESLTLEPRGGPMGSGAFSSGAFSAGAASSCGGREGGRGGERTGRCARALSDRRERRGVFSCVAAVAGRRAPGRRATGNRKRAIGPRMPFERGSDVPPRARGRRREPCSGPWRRICC